MKERNLIGDLLIMKERGIKPNFSAIAREYGVDRHTVKKYYENGGKPLRKQRERKSKWDPYLDEIIELMDNVGVTKKAVHVFLKDKYKENLPGNYNSFKSYTLRKGIHVKKSSIPHVLYETSPGDVLQVDWKEDMKLHLKDGTEICFNVFSATLSYSREHIFIYSRGKTTSDFIRCMIETFRRLGGVSERVLTDNMSAVVSCRGSNKKVHTEITQLFKDLGCRLELCKARTPQTKGKTENSNKFVNWIRAYEGQLEKEEDIIHTIEEVINADANNQNNSTTKLPPAVLFKKEKEYLKPLPSSIMLESYITDHTRQTVPDTLLVYYKGNKYSVGPAYLGKTVDIYPSGNSIYIYHNKDLITIHSISQNGINYKKEHYEEGLSMIISGGEVDIEKAARENLEKLDLLNEIQKEGESVK